MNKTLFFLPLFYCQLLCLSKNRVQNCRLLGCIFQDYYKFLPIIIKATRCTNFSNLFWNKTLHVSDSSSVHHQKFFIVHTSMVYVIQVLLTAFSQVVSKPVSRCTVIWTSNYKFLPYLWSRLYFVIYIYIYIYIYILFFLYINNSSLYLLF